MPSHSLLSPVTPEAAALLTQIENHCTVECCGSDRDYPHYNPWTQAAVAAAADLWALRKGWPAEMVRATFKNPIAGPAKTVVAWNATTCVLETRSDA